MAYDGIEVEIKLRADDTAAANLHSLLQRAGAREIHQVDTYFHKAENSFVDREPISEWLSVRDRGKVFLNYKKFHFGNDGLATHSEEVDLIVADVAEAERLLGYLGFERLIVVDKRRFVAELEGFEVALDQVAELGSFVEIEAITSMGTVDETRARLFEFAEALGLDRSTVDHKGYPHLLLEYRRNSTS